MTGVPANYLTNRTADPKFSWGIIRFWPLVPTNSTTNWNLCNQIRQEMFLLLYAIMQGIKEKIYSAANSEKEAFFFCVQQDLELNGRFYPHKAPSYLLDPSSRARVLQSFGKKDCFLWKLLPWILLHESGCSVTPGTLQQNKNSAFFKTKANN